MPTEQAPQLDGPYWRNRRLRAAIYFGVLCLGLFLVSLPAWAIRGASAQVWSTVVAAAGAVSIGAGIGALVQERLDPTFDAVNQAFLLQVQDGRAGNLRGIIHAEVAQALAEVAASGVDFGPRAKLLARLAVSDTESELLIQAISLSQKWLMTQLLEDLFRRKPEFTVRILLMHPYSPHVSRREVDLGFQAGTLRQLIDETILPLASLSAAMGLGSRLQVRGYQGSPYYGIICADRNRIVISLPRERRGGDQNFGVYAEAASRAASDMIADLVHGFDDRWAASTDILSFVSIAFKPSSERVTSGRIEFEVQADAELNVASLRVSSENLTEVRAAALSTTGSYLISGRFDAPGHPIHVVVESAIGVAGGWLRSPVRIQLPPPAVILGQPDHG